MIFLKIFFRAMQQTEAQRFIQEVQRVISLGKEKSIASLAKKIGKTSQYFTDLKSGKMALTRSVLDQAAEIIEIDKEYILIGERVIFSPMMRFN